MSKSAENIIKTKISRDIIVFAISWMGTRDIIISIVLTSCFILISDYFLNYESRYCCVPKKYQNIVLEDDDITDEELNKAIAILEKSKKNKEIQQQHNTYMRYFHS
jgi:hypothetical protein